MPDRTAIDIHAHMIVPSVSARGAVDVSYWQDPFGAYASQETNEYNDSQWARVTEAATDPAVRLSDMDDMEVEVQAVAIAPPQYYYAADPSLGEDIAQEQNDTIAEHCATDPDRLRGIATVPLQDVERAVSELKRAVRIHKFRAVEISTNINGLDLDARRFDAFWAAAVELDVGVIIHPHGFTHGQRLRDYYLVNTIGNPLDSTVAVHRMIYGGVLERYPDLRVCVVHGGGFTPFYSSRMDHSFRERPECRKHITELPSTYLRKMFVDCLVYDAFHLRHLIEAQGIEQIVIGTDYPYDMGFYRPVDQIDEVGLSDEHRSLLLRHNAERFLGL